MIKIKRILVVICLGLLSFVCKGQDSNRIQQIENQLKVLVIDQPGLDESVETSVSDVSITEYIRSLGINHELNINVSDNLDQKLINNFAKAKVLDVLVFLCKEYELNMEIIGGIMSISKYEKPEEPVIEKPLKLPTVAYNDQNDFLSLDLRRDSLGSVAKEITKMSMRNVILAPELDNRPITVFIQNRPFKDALEKMCFANGLEVEEDGNFFLIRPSEELNVSEAQKGRNGRKGNNVQQGNDQPEPDGEITVTDNGNETYTIFCKDAGIKSLVDKMSKTALKNYFIYSEPEGAISLYIENATYDQFLSHVLHGTEFSFIKQEGIYLIGSVENDLLQTTELIQLKNRTIENVLTSTNRAAGQSGASNSSSAGRSGGNRSGSSAFSRDLDVQSFPELNAFIVSGSFPEVKRFKDFMRELDQVVPVVLIEVLLVDVNRSKSINAGINAGLGENAGQTTGPISGEAGLNVDLSTDAINELLSSFNNLGLVNLGSISPNFYMSIHALETNGILKTRSTPKLSTLNSYTASLSIGRQEYYLETQTNVNASASNNVVTEQQIWKPLDANLSLEITPVVSGAEQVTMEIQVIQSQFTERSGANGPFGKATREFASSIRVKNGDMILLGGLEDKTLNDSGSGLPFLSRIPVIKWFFGSRSRSKSKSELSIFIRPTIMY